MQRTRSQSEKPFSSRRGSILVAALVCLAIVTLIMLSVFKTSLSQRHQIRLEEQQVQAELIAESGLERAVARLQKDDGYTGEDWTIDAEQLDARNAALAKIKVTNSNNQVSIAVTVKFPQGSMKPSQAARELTLELTPNTPVEKTPDEKETEGTEPKNKEPNADSEVSE